MNGEGDGVEWVRGASVLKPVIWVGGSRSGGEEEDGAISGHKSISMYYSYFNLLNLYVFKTCYSTNRPGV